MKFRHALLLLTALTFLAGTLLNFGMEVPFHTGAFLLSLMLAALWIATSYFFGYAKRNGFPVLGTFYFAVSVLLTAAALILNYFNPNLGLLGGIIVMILYGFSVTQIFHVLPDLGDLSFIWFFALLLLLYAACFFSFRAGRRRFKAELEEKRKNWKPVEYN